MLIKEKSTEKAEKFYSQGLRKEARDEYVPTKKSRFCLKSCGCFIIFLILIALTIYATFFYIIGPIVKAVDNLPEDFPKELVIYNSTNSSIKIQDGKDKEKVESILKLLPDSIISPFLKFLSTDIKTQIIQKTSQGIEIKKNATINDLKNYFGNPDFKNTKSVSIASKEIERKKEELSEFYRKQLINKEFQFKENISDYDINLQFWKNDIFGIINIKDSTEINKSDTNITISY